MGLGSYPDVGLKEDIRGHGNAHAVCEIVALSLSVLIG